MENKKTIKGREKSKERFLRIGRGTPRIRINIEDNNGRKDRPSWSIHI